VIRYVTIVEVLPHWGDAPSLLENGSQPMHGLRAVQTRVEYGLNPVHLWSVSNRRFFHHLWRQRDPLHGESKSARYRSPVTGATRVFSPNDRQADQVQNWQDNFSFQLQLCSQVNRWFTFHSGPRAFRQSTKMGVATTEILLILG